jgi:hypothetical protein
MYVLYCIQRQRIMKRASVGCGQCNIWTVSFTWLRIR